LAGGSSVPCGAPCGGTDCPLECVVVPRAIPCRKESAAAPVASDSECESCTEPRVCEHQELPGREIVREEGIAMCRTPMRIYTQGRSGWFQRAVQAISYIAAAGITPQAMRLPAFPAGSDFMSSAFSWTMIEWPSTEVAGSEPSER
jgi:hypothetical protein